MARGLTLLGAVLLGACSGRAPGVTLPGFAAGLPGNTLAVAWGPRAATLAARAAALPLGLRLVPGQPPEVCAVTADALEVGWSSLADNRWFQAAAAELGGAGDHLFVDLQQAVDVARVALPRAFATAGADGRWRGIVEDRVTQALRLEALEWLSVRASEPGAYEVVVASGSRARGVLAVFGDRAQSGPVESVPSGGLVTASGTVVPGVAAIALREVLADDAEGPMAVLQQFLRASGAQGWIDALVHLDGRFALAATRDWAWAACGVRDEVRLEAALDRLATARGDHWLVLGRLRLALEGGALLVSFGDVPAPRQALPASTAAIRIDIAAPPMRIEATRRGPRLRIDVHVP